MPPPGGGCFPGTVGQGLPAAKTFLLTRLCGREKINGVVHLQDSCAMSLLFGVVRLDGVRFDDRSAVTKSELPSSRSSPRADTSDATASGLTGAVRHLIRSPAKAFGVQVRFDLPAGANALQSDPQPENIRGSLVVSWATWPGTECEIRVLLGTKTEGPIERRLRLPPPSMARMA